MKDAVQLEIDSSIAHVRINRPKAMNAIHPDISVQLTSSGIKVASADC